VIIFENFSFALFTPPLGDFQDVIKYMLQNPIMSGRIGKWAYALIEYDLAYEPLKAMKARP
jgi:hypothetical protein